MDLFILLFLTETLLLIIFIWLILHQIGCCQRYFKKKEILFLIKPEWAAYLS